MADSGDEQAEELLALQAIYGDAFEHQRQDGTLDAVQGAIRLWLALPGESSTLMLQSDSTSCQVSHLPPVLLRFVLPTDYPATALPHLDVQCDSINWLKRADQARLARHIMQQLHTGQAVLYEAADMLVNDWSRILEIDTAGWTVPQHILKKMVAFDNAQSAADFDTSLFNCGICLTRRQGDKCFRFADCNHVFCKQCLCDFYAVLVSEGVPRSVMRCPDPGCVALRVKAAATAASTEQEADDEGSTRLVEQCRSIGMDDELIDRWLELYMMRRHEADPTMTWCTRPGCDGPARKESDGKYSKMATCLLCRFTFCHVCGKTWHGSRVGCQVKNSMRLATEYLAADDDGKRAFEYKYGVVAIKRVLHEYEEEQASRQWMRDNAMPCPGCQTFVVKSSGCNHMTCRVCVPPVHFCNLCGVHLSPHNPYAHFSDRTQGCYGMLFDRIPDEGEFEDDGFEVV
ncbi:hypothetical protein RI367_003482 [Sorochytrium milnesiophthora]